MSESELKMRTLQLENSEKRLTAHMDELKTEVILLKEKMKNPLKVNYALIVAFMGLCITIISIIGKLSLMPVRASLGNLEATQKRNLQAIERHLNIPGHPESFTRIENLEKLLERGQDSLKDKFNSIEQSLNRIENKH